MKNLLKLFVLFTFLVLIQGCNERDEFIMERNFSSLPECLSAMEDVSQGPIKIVIDTPELVTGNLANQENFGCERMNTGTQSIYFYGYYYVLRETQSENKTSKIPSISIQEVMDELHKYAAKLVASSENNINNPIVLRADNDYGYYVIKFQTSDPKLMYEDVDKVPGAYERNVERTMVWNSKFCTSELKNLMTYPGVNQVSGVILDSKTQDSLAISMCTR
ncbi:MAG: hypothetical protein ACXW2E_12755 [Nitrososphaeraceae archaeon]